MDFEVILKQIGGFGRYQIFLILVVLYSNMVLLTNVCFMVFGAMPLPEECQKLENLTAVNCSHFESVLLEWNLVDDLKFVPFLLNTVTMFGFLLGAMAAGYLSDAYGRKTIWFTSEILMCLCGILCSLSPNWQAFAVFRFLIGLFGSGYVVTVITMLTEIMSKTHRLWTIEVYLLWELGFIYFAALAYTTQNWRHTTAIANAALLPALVAFRWVYESPRWLIQKGRMDEAATVLARIAARNCHPGPYEAELVAAPPTPHSGWFYLFGSKELLVHLLSLVYCTFATFCALYSLLFDVGQLVGNAYASTALFGAVKVVPVTAVIAADRLTSVGRRGLLAFSFAGTLGCMLVLVGVRLAPADAALGWLRNAAAIVGSCCINPAIAACFLYPAELFPTLVRNRAAGLASTAGRVGCMLAPLVLFSKHAYQPLPSLLIALICAGGVLVALCFMPETRGRPLPELKADKLAEADDTADQLCDDL